jgi:hypothetical protein
MHKRVSRFQPLLARIFVEIRLPLDGSEDKRHCGDKTTTQGNNSEIINLANAILFSCFLMQWGCVRRHTACAHYRGK